MSLGTIQIFWLLLTFSLVSYVIFQCIVAKWEVLWNSPVHSVTVICSDFRCQGNNKHPRPIITQNATAQALEEMQHALMAVSVSSETCTYTDEKFFEGLLYAALCLDLRSDKGSVNKLHCLFPDFSWYEIW